MGTKARYPGAQPFADDDLSRKLFRGREREATFLLSQILVNRLVVLFAGSGVGKTSLLNAGVAENLRAEGLLPLTVRLNNTVMGPLESLYAGVADASARQQVEFIPGDKRSLWHFFKTAEFWKKNSLQIPVLILDQFEELFTLQPEEQRGAFIDQLSYLIRGVRPSAPSSEVMGNGAWKAPNSDSPPEIRVVISLREDFFPYLEELADRIPEILHQRFRLQPLARVAASRALEEPATIDDPSLATRPFEVESGGRNAILDFLAWRAPSKIKKSSSDIEPFQLQLLCQHVEEIANSKQHQNPQNGIKVTASEIGEWSDLRNVLENFYLRQVRAIPSFRQRRAVSRLCQELLISPQGRRLRMEESEIKRHASVNPATLRTLINQRLLRADQTPDGTYYELSHDTLIEAILASSRRSFAFRMVWYLVVGLVCFVFAFVYLATVFVMPISVFFSKHEPSEFWLLTVLLPSSLFLGSISLWVGIQNIKKFRDIRRRSGISRRADVST